jgi:two-component system sensor histidine kinase YesM
MKRGTVAITVEKRETNLAITIYDDGVGMDKATLARKQSSTDVPIFS